MRGGKGQYQELLLLKRNLLPGTEGGSFFRVRGVSEWSERGRTGAQEVNGGFLGKRTEGVLRVRERRQRNVGKRKIRRVGGRGREGRGSVSGGSGWEGYEGLAGRS